MSNLPYEAVQHGSASWDAPELDLPEIQPDFPHESFDSAPYPFAIMLGATTTLLLIATLCTLWLLATG